MVDPKIGFLECPVYLGKSSRLPVRCGRISQAEGAKVKSDRLAGLINAKNDTRLHRNRKCNRIKCISFRKCAQCDIRQDVSRISAAA